MLQFFSSHGFFRTAAICAAAAAFFSAPAAGAAPAKKPVPARRAAAKPAAKKTAPKPAAKPAPTPAPKPAASDSAISTAYRSPRNSQRPLRKSTKFIVLHTTEGAAKGALEKLSANGECHYVVDTDGKTYSIVDRGRVAYHAGLSMWNALTGLDSVSVGIEVVGWHDKPVTDAQVAALKKLLADLKSAYKVQDDKVLTHSMVAFGNPNHWHKRKHRGRKRCGMQFADPALRLRIGLSSKPAYDPDLRAGRLFDADPELTKILYRKVSVPQKPATRVAAAPKAAGPPPGQAAAKGGQKTAPPSESGSGAKKSASGTAPAANVIGPRLSAWDIARDKYDSASTTYRFPNGTVKKGSEISGKEWRKIPAGTVVTIGDTGDQPSDNSDEGLLEIGEDGSVHDLGGDEVASSTTFYFPPGKDWARGSTLSLAQIDALPSGTKMLVGYKTGGPVSAKKPVFAICGLAWNHPDTYYWDPARRKVVSGDDIDEKNIPKGAVVFWR